MSELKGKRLGILIAMCGLAASVGIVSNISGLFFEPVSETLDTGRGDVSMSLTICLLAIALGGMMSEKLVAPARFKPAILLGMLAQAGCTALLSLAHSIPVLYVLNTVRGFATGVLGFVLVTRILNRWFTKNTGLIASICLGCSGLAASVFSPPVTVCIRNAGWQKGYLLCAGLIVLMDLPALTIPFSLSPGTNTGADPAARTSPAAGSEKRHAGLLAAGILISASASAVTAFPQHFPGLSVNYSLSAYHGSAMLSVCMLSNTGSKLLFGAVADRLGAKATLRLFAVLILAALILLFSRSPAVLILAALLTGFSYGLATVGPVILTRDIFGLSSYDRVYPVLSFAGFISSAFFASLIGFMYDGSGDYSSSLILLITVDIVMLGALLYIYGKKRAK